MDLCFLQWQLDAQFKFKRVNDRCCFQEATVALSGWKMQREADYVIRVTFIR